MPRNGGRILVEQIAANGVTRAFGVPGESYLAALDAFYDTPGTEFVVCRQEGGAAMMADAWARLTGGPGVAFVTRGPGATNASPAVHIARQDSVPLVLVVGQIDSAWRGREAFQEIDYQAFFGPIANGPSRSTASSASRSSSTAPSPPRCRAGRVRSSSPCPRTSSRPRPRSSTRRR